MVVGGPAGGGLGEDGLGGGGGEAVAGGGGLGVVDQGLGQGGGWGGGDADHVGLVLAEEAATAGAVGGELGGLLDQGEGGEVVAGGVLDQGRVDQGGDQLLEVVDLPGPGQDAGGQVAGRDHVALPGQDLGDVAPAADGQVVAAVGQVPGDRLVGQGHRLLPAAQIEQGPQSRGAQPHGGLGEAPPLGEVDPLLAHRQGSLGALDQPD